MTNHFSKGCQLCQQGKWLCIFLTYECNANCHFCPAPYKDDHIHSAFGNTKEEVLSYLIQNDFEGISFSGGDPFVVFDRLIDWFVYLKKNLPDYYFWVYTNGLDCNEEKLEKLSSEGMDEIRFNIAATGYSSTKVWEQIKIARKLFRFVSVEIPSISKDFHLLEAALEKLHFIGIDYLNMHDYILSDSDTACLNEKYDIFVLNKIINLKYAHASTKNTLDIIELSLERGYNFRINHCSMKEKEFQMTLRRLIMGKIFNDPDYDKVMEDGTICNTYIIPHERSNNEILTNIMHFNYVQGLKPYLLKISDSMHQPSIGFKKLIVSYIPQMEISNTKTFINIVIE